MFKVNNIVSEREDGLYLAEQCRALDRAATEQGVPSFQLMNRAARAVFDVLQREFFEMPPLQVVCGTGNNGGDGFLIAALAHERGWRVSCILVGDSNKIKGDAKRAYEYAAAAGVPLVMGLTEPAKDDAVIVDALLGTGLKNAVRAEAAQAIEWVNASSATVIAVDVPSGLCSDTGAILGHAVQADMTVTFIGLKLGLFTHDGPDCAGMVIFNDLEVAESVYGAFPPAAYRLDLDSLMGAIQPRRLNSHKGHYGHVLLIGGDYGFAGAIAMAAEAAIASGAGLVSVATRAEHVAGVVARTPEAMVHAVSNRHELVPLLDRADVVVIGPGLGRSPWSEQLLQRCLECEIPMVLDADALNLVADLNWYERLQRNGENRIITPHPGEAARLLKCSTVDVQQDRLQSVQSLREQVRCSVVLKGCGSLLATEKGVFLSDYGNPGMASGGMGDVLSGVLGGLLAQSQNIELSLALGVCLHGRAAEIAAEAGQNGLRATQLMPVVQELLGGH